MIYLPQYQPALSSSRLFNHIPPHSQTPTAIDSVRSWGLSKQFKCRKPLPRKKLFECSLVELWSSNGELGYPMQSQHSVQIGACPSCLSTRIRLRRQRHRRFLWRCLSCRRAFVSPAVRNIQLPMGAASASGGTYVLARNIPRMERSRRISAGNRVNINRRRRRKGFPVTWLVLLVALAAGVYWWVEQQDLDWSQLPTQLASKGRELTTFSSGAVDERVSAERTASDPLLDSARAERVSQETGNSSRNSPDEEPLPTPSERYMEEKLYMLELINTQRDRAGLNPVTLGTNTAAQIHAEAALENCFSSHWGIDGIKAVHEVQPGRGLPVKRRKRERTRLLYRKFREVPAALRHKA